MALKQISEVTARILRAVLAGKPAGARDSRRTGAVVEELAARSLAVACERVKSVPPVLDGRSAEQQGKGICGPGLIPAGGLQQWSQPHAQSSLLRDSVTGLDSRGCAIRRVVPSALSTHEEPSDPTVTLSRTTLSCGSFPAAADSRIESASAPTPGQSGADAPTADTASQPCRRIR